MAFLEDHIKVHEDADEVTPTTANNVAFKSGSIECSSCHKILPTKEALKSHFQVSIVFNLQGNHVL